MLFPEMAKSPKKSRAQIQKLYRDRKKASDPQFLERERERQKKYRVPIAQLSAVKQATVRAQNRQYRKTYVNKIKTQQQQEQATVNTPRGTRSSTSPLLVNFDFQSARRRAGSVGGRKRVSRALSNARRRIQILEHQLQEARKAKEKAQQETRTTSAEVSRMCSTSKITTKVSHHTSQQGQRAIKISRNQSKKSTKESVIFPGNEPCSYSGGG